MTRYRASNELFPPVRSRNNRIVKLQFWQVTTTYQLPTSGEWGIEDNFLSGADELVQAKARVIGSVFHA
ncbi:MAG: hypothetical protein DMF72_03535 [Acidobacteria bacterium]|nr:MAG: hypothetical protein DMF72_03535 [Acidobacteriota bacterium]